MSQHGAIYKNENGTLRKFSGSDMDSAVTQTNTTENAEYRPLLSGSANDVTETATAKKSTGLKYNPRTHIITVGNGETDTASDVKTSDGISLREINTNLTESTTISLDTSHRDVKAVNIDKLVIQNRILSLAVSFMISSTGSTTKTIGSHDYKCEEIGRISGVNVTKYFSYMDENTFYYVGDAQVSSGFGFGASQYAVANVKNMYTNIALYVIKVDNIVYLTTINGSHKGYSVSTTSYPNVVASDAGFRFVGASLLCKI